MPSEFDLDELLDGVDIDTDSDTADCEDGLEDGLENDEEKESISHSVPDETRVNESVHKATRSPSDNSPSNQPKTPEVLPPINGASLDHFLTCDCPQCKHDLEPVPVTFDSPSRPFTRRETLLLAYAFPARVGETTKEISARTGIPESTIYRYKAREDFNAELALITKYHLGEHRHRTAAALVDGACTPGKGQAAMQRVYWTLLGDLVDTRRLQHKIEDPEEVLASVLGIPRSQLPE